MKNGDTPFVTAQVARQAESGDPMARHSISVALANLNGWAHPECQAFAAALDARTTAFLLREFGPLIGRHPALTDLLRETDAVRAEYTAMNLRRWDKSAGREA